MKRLVKAVLFATSLLLGFAVGGWVALSLMYLAVEPAERNPSTFLLIAVVVALLAGLAFATRRLYSVIGLGVFASTVFAGMLVVGWMLS